MLNAVIRFALRHRGLIVLASLAVMVYGTYVATILPIDVFPDLDRPRVTVMTESHGLAAEDVETLVTVPLESALLGSTGVLNVRSQSGPGLSVVLVEFDWGTNPYLARQVVQERLASAAALLPNDVRPNIQPISSVMGQIMLIGMARKPGPQGGVLVPVGRTGAFAELVHASDSEEATLSLWTFGEPSGSRPGMEDARPLATPMSSVKLGWPGLKGGPVLLRSTAAEGDPSSHFTAKDPRLRGLVLDPKSGEATVTVTIAGQDHQIDFSPQRQGLELRTLADWVVRQRLLKLPGIAQITVMGGGRKQYQVLLDPDALFRQGVTVHEVEEAAAKNNLNATGGFADLGGREQPIRIFGRVGSDPDKVLDELRKLPIRRTPGRTIRLEQIASRIVEGPQIPRGDASINGRPGVLLTVHKQPHVDTRRLTTQVLDALREVEATLPPDVFIDPDVFQMKNFIDRGLFNVAEALVLGAVLVLIVLFLFLLNFRTTFISLTAIPLSLAITALVFAVVGSLTGTPLTINVMTLGGLAVAIGELVDDAIVDVENIFRRLRENAHLPEPRPMLAVVYEASKEVRNAIVYGTAVVILVFVPLLALPGIEGRLFGPLAIAYIVSILASLLVSLTVTPVLSSYLLPKAKATHRDEDSPLLRWMKAGATPLIRLSMARPGLLLLVSWGLVAGAVWHLTTLGTNFLPPFDEGTMQVNLMLPPEASLNASNRLAAAVDERFKKLRADASDPKKPILSFLRMSGRAELDEHVEPVNNTHYFLRLNPESGLDREEVKRLVLEDLAGDPKAGVPGAVPYADIEAEQPLAHLIDHMLSGVSAQISVKIFGDDLDTLRRIGTDLQQRLQGIQGLLPPVLESQQMNEEIHVRLRPDDLSLNGLSREHVARIVETALQGEVVGQVLLGQRRFDLLVRLDDPYRTDYRNLGRLRIDVPGENRTVLLSDLADIGPGFSPNYIQRENARRRLVLRCNTLDRDVGSVALDIQERLSEVPLPPGYFLELGGQFQNQREATLRIVLLTLVSLLGMYLVLNSLFPSYRIVLQILNALPTAFIGGVLALVLTRQNLTVAAMVGFISLGGIAVRNGILLVTHYFHLMREEGERFSPDMILRGSLERLAPVLMTALTAGIALVPLVLGGFEPGREILYPVATVILGGLVTSTLCEFLIHPGLFLRFSGKDAGRLSHAAHAPRPETELH